MNNPHDSIDLFKLRLAQAVLDRNDLAQIRERSISNLDRWKSQGAWCADYWKWRELMATGSDNQVRTAMTSTDENSNRLRQSPPYAGLLDEETRASLWKSRRLVDE